MNYSTFCFKFTYKLTKISTRYIHIYKQKDSNIRPEKKKSCVSSDPRRKKGVGQPKFFFLGTSVGVNCLPAMSMMSAELIYHTYAQKWWSGKLFITKKKKYIYIFKSRRFCLTCGSARVRIHFLEAPRWSGPYQMYVNVSAVSVHPYKQVNHIQIRFGNEHVAQFTRSI